MINAKINGTQQRSLTLTLDVFKFKKKPLVAHLESCLTLTLDVFKFTTCRKLLIIGLMFNFNIRCI